MEDCPCCHGSGRALVSMAGFSTAWLVDCPYCGGKGKVYAYRAARLRGMIERRVAAHLPRCHPEGMLR